ncbi:hypothetical protein ACFXAQ_12130 [Streptomyces olivaceus]|uniref:hypothetical protein n=1 Tax=Streptomyces olivaceus TaxID=47716 RepID=UPI001CCCB56B|nr:hypothetical protein [Streptomyces olivaceus]MBZ6294345.1 hypothetical protein [Streptomyces olivaceus]MBZ6329310.1 hypothetical protein [Streptomyces olivaceus]
MSTNLTTSAASEPGGGASSAAPPPGGRKPVIRLAAIVVGLTAAITVMLCAFALPSVNGGPHHAPLGVTGPAAQSVQAKLDGDAWDVTVYDDAEALTDAIEDRDAVGGIVLGSDGVTVLTATAGGQLISTAIGGLGETLAEQQHVSATVRDLVPFPADDPRGTGLTGAALPMVFGGMLPAIVLLQVFPGHARLRTRLAGVVAFALAAGVAVSAVLTYGTGTLDGNFWITSLGLALGMAALAVPFLGLESLFGFAGFGAGAAVTMFLGNPLSGLPTGPYWLPDGWSTFGQLLPPGASGSLLRANAYFDGTGAGGPALVLTAWAAVGLVLMLAADRRNRRKGAARPAV